jgi:hypothetical protein
MAGGNISWITDKSGKIVDHAEPGTSLNIADYRDYMIGNSPMAGYSLELGIDYHITPTIAPFLNLGFDSSRNLSVINPVGSYAEHNFYSVIRTIRIIAGIYF